LETGRLLERFVHRADHHLCGAVQTAPAPIVASKFLQARIWDLRRCFAPAVLHLETLHGRSTVATQPERLRSFGETATKRADYTSGDNGHAGAPFVSVRSLSISHFDGIEASGIPFAFGSEKPYLSRRKENGAREVGGLSVEFISGGSKSDEREQ